ncbi:glutathione transferase GstA [Sphingosinicella rhizophila]|uniref:Glutathione transferase GstA n=1 Tax=Sphingosinicella rhizophila TaxID=3050082 RepID=A0ABU3Q1W7_9SPHN|nr:glutathione transferase GstA [Sphingosinicella sp. GR2756]MDT9597411.1 glutathione transferase GstA [Sphingosinicella sp. GR2756]
MRSSSRPWGNEAVKLYFSPGACSQAPNIAFREAGLDIELVKVDLKSKRLESGEDYRVINPKGSVPALALDDHIVLTENAVVLQYIADQAPEAGLIPPYGTIRRYQLLEWLNYIATELHKGFAPLFHPQRSAEATIEARELLAAKFDYVASRMEGNPFLTGESFTIADCYLFVVLRWSRIHHIDLGRWPALAAFVARVAERPAVRAALHSEGMAR